MRYLTFPLALLLTGCFCLVSVKGEARARKDRHVVLISLDGFGADNWESAQLPMPNIRRMAAEGSRAERMTVVTPSVTWPNHTTLVTGVSPARHGVLGNGRVEAGTAGSPPFAIVPRRSKQELCRAVTLYDVAHAAGLRTAEVNWPVTRGAPTLHWSFPDHPEALDHTTPALLQDLQRLGFLNSQRSDDFTALGPVTRDRIWTEAAIHLLKRDRPNLLLLHLLNTDGQQHAHGPGTTEARTALELADRHVGDVLAGIRAAGLERSTAVFVVADHGFIRVTQQLRPNARLRSRGLIREEGGKTVYDAWSIAEGGVALVYVPGRSPERVARTREALLGMAGVGRILGIGEMAPVGLPEPGTDPQAPDLVLCADEGFAFTNETALPEVLPLTRPIGTHGYLHTQPRMDALLVARGAGIRRGGRLERARSLDVAPTLARLLGVDLPQVEGKPLEALLQP